MNNQTPYKTKGLLIITRINYFTRLTHVPYIRLSH